MKNPNEIKISVSQVGNSVKVIADDDIMEFYIQSETPVNQIRYDFAVWLFLPVAMRCGADIIVEGAGSQTTIDNAEKISQIWESWIPSKFRSISVKFSQMIATSDEKVRDNTLCFYSGGADSTYCIRKRFEKGRRQSLLTIHGMDYNFGDNEKFSDLLSKTSAFSEKYGIQRLIVKTNAYAVYEKYKVNTRINHISHIFALAGCGFLFSENYNQIVLAADHRLDQQFSVHPYGSNSATNFLFNDGALH